MATSATPSNTTQLDSNLRSFGEKLFTNSRVIIAFAVGILVVAAVGTLTMNRRQAKSDEAKNALFAAEQTLLNQFKDIAKADNPPAPAPKAPQKTPNANGAKTPPPPEAESDPDSVAFKRMDVDAILAKPIEQFQSVVTHFPGTRAAYEAQIQLGDLYFQHGQADKAVSWFERAVKDAPNSMEKALSLHSLGYAYENAGKHKEAVESLQHALNQKLDSIKGDTLLALARNQEALKDVAQARATYDRILSELPNSEYATTAQRLKGQLGQ